MTSLSFDPLISPPAWIAMAAVACGLLVIYGLKRAASFTRLRWALVIGLMGLGVALVMLILLNPIWVEPAPPPGGKPLLTVLLDASASMATPDSAEDETRFQSGAALALQFEEELSNQFDVRLRTFSTEAAPASPQSLRDVSPEGPMTNLSAALTQSLHSARPQGHALVLLSDGIHNGSGGSAEVLDATRVAKAMAAPVYTRCFGGHASAIDLALGFRSSQEIAFVGQRLQVSVFLEHHGTSGGRAEVALLQDSEEIDRRSVLLSGEGVTPVQFTIEQETKGLYRYEARTEPYPGEVVLANNSASFSLRVIDEPIHVLLLEGKPYWDTKFLLRTIAQDASIELESLIRVASGRLIRRVLKTHDAIRDGSDVATGEDAEASGNVPAERIDRWELMTDAAEVLADPERLRSYQIIILGRDTEDFLNDVAVANLKRWMSKDGGALVCFRGSPTTKVHEKLGRLMPVRWSPTRESRFRMKLTERGEALHLLPSGGRATVDLANLPTLATVSMAEKPHPLSVVLATAEDPNAGNERPVLSYRPYGVGRAVAIEGSGMWRWAFLPPQYNRHDGVYDLLWQSIIRWLVSSSVLLPGQDLALRCDKITFNDSEPATATLLVRNEASFVPMPTVRLTGAGLDHPQDYSPIAIGEEPGAFRINFGKLPKGRYEAAAFHNGHEIEKSKAVFEVCSFFREHLDMEARPALMARIADETGGVVLAEDPCETIVEKFREHVDRSRPMRVNRTSAWDRWWVLSAVFAVWMVTWGIRRHGGLI